MLRQRIWIATFVAFAFASADHSASAQNACRGGTLRVGYSADAVGLDPHLTTALNSELMFEFVYSGLLKVDNQTRIQPDLAASWSIDESATLYTFKLRSDVAFHNGRRMTSADVLYSFDRILKSKGAFSARFSDIASIEAPDDSTVVFRLKQPFAPFLSVLATTKAAVVPKEVVEEKGDLQNVMVGTGPFKFVSYQPGNSLVLARNDNYYDKSSTNLDGMELRVIPDEVTRIAALRSGDIDFAQITDPLSLKIVERDKALKSVIVPLLRRSLVVLNVNHGPLRDVRVREAIALVIDRQEIIDLALGGFGEPSGPFPKGLSAWALPLSSIPFYNEAPNVEKAKKLLGDAGFPNGFTIKTLAAPQYRSHILVAEILQQQLAKIGIKFDIQVTEWGVLLSNWGKNTFETITMTYAGRSDPYFYTFERLHSRSPGNASRLNDPEIDRLSEEGASSSDPIKRKEIYDKLQVRMAEMSALVYVATETEQFAMRDTVQGYVGMPDGTRSYLAKVSLKSSCK